MDDYGRLQKVQKAFPALFAGEAGQFLKQSSLKEKVYT
jgi:hypothetical protein